MRQSYHSVLKWSLLTGTSTILLKLCYESVFNVTLRTSTKSLSTYESTLISWASTGVNSKEIQNKPIDTTIRDDLQLIGAQIYFRHGARTPLSLLPGLEEPSYTREHIEMYPPSKWDIKLITKLGNDIVSKDKVLSANDIIGDRIKKLKSTSDLKVVTGQLTAIGEKQLYQVGQLIRSEIIKQDQHQLIPSTYDSDIVYCRSTYMDRTIASARCFLAGLFSSEKDDNKIKSKGPFEIEVQNFPDEDMFPNPKVAPELKNCPTVIALYKSLNDNHDLKVARQALIDHIGKINSFNIFLLF
ncbi:unnamed protein product [Rotaria magnacalcarata]|uniref:2-phosphoxylose phosphatase 1 n=1 Tax=Rotaria magnacalcarata TaxID=392030 RepID=A0A8S2SU46_9BILA|nr:unnamed protein product [Rotaria magnacalcarata]